LQLEALEDTLEPWAVGSRATTARSTLRPSSGTHGGPDRQHTGLSPAAQRENLRKEQYEQVIERAKVMMVPDNPKSRGRKMSHPDAMSDAAESVQLLKPEEFVEGVNHLDQAIEELSRSVRLEHLVEGGSQSDEKARQAREEARRRLDAEQRRARQKEQQARDPHRKVALRLENKRRFEQETLAEAGIPMSQVDVKGGRGGETVSLVDVQGLRSRCQMLDQGLNVRAMLDRKKNMELQERRRSMAASAPQLGGLLDSVTDGNTLWPLDGRYEDRLERVKARNQMHHADGIVRKLASRRNKEPYPLPFVFKVEEVGDLGTDEDLPSKRRLAVVSGRTFGPQRHAYGRRKTEVAGVLTQQFKATMQGSSTHVVPVSSTATSSVCHRNSAVLHKFVGDLAIGMTKPEGSVARPRQRRSGAAQHSPLERPRGRSYRNWSLARSVAKVLVLYFHILRRNQAMDLVLGLLRELGEWVRVKRTIHRFIGSVISIQRFCRLFILNKRRRCEWLSKEWQRVEDLHLASYFKLYSQEVLSEMKGLQHRSHSLKDGPGNSRASFGDTTQGPALESNFPRHSSVRLSQPSLVTGGRTLRHRQRRQLVEMLEEGVETGDLQADWRIYRIPANERRAMITQYYSMKVLKRARSQTSFHECVQQAVVYEREVHQFLKFFGAESSPSHNPVTINTANMQAVSMLPFWHFTEDEFLMLIALSAQALIKTKPFKDHPANKGLPETLRRQKSKEASEAGATSSNQSITGPSVAERAAAHFKRIDPARGVPMGRLRREDTRKSRGASKATALQGKGRVDIDEVFRCFTPRLRDISEEQAVEYRGSAEVTSGVPGEHGTLVSGSVLAL